MRPKRFVFVSDTHAPYHLPQAIALVCAFIKDYKPEILIFGGDIVDFITASKFVRMNASRGPRTVAQEAFIGVLDVIEPICDAAGPKCEKHFLEGNHEIRVLRMISASAPVLEGLVDLSDILGCQRNGITYHASKAGNARFTIGNLTFMHGERYGANPAKLQMDDWGGPVIFGHSHKESSHRRKTGSGRDELALGAGCLCADPDYRDYDQYTRGFVAGWVNPETKDYHAEHIRLSGDNYSYLYSPYGEYNAKYVSQNGKSAWTADRIKDSAIGRGSQKSQRALLRSKTQS